MRKILIFLGLLFVMLSNIYAQKRQTSDWIRIELWDRN